MSYNKKLTKEDINNIKWNPFERYALINKETKHVAYTSNVKELMTEILDKISPKSPLANKLQLVERKDIEDQIGMKKRGRPKPIK